MLGGVVCEIYTLYVVLVTSYDLDNFYPQMQNQEPEK